MFSVHAYLVYVFLLRGEVMRQAVTARRLASSPPAPSPSKRPKRAGPQLPPRELARLAEKQLAYLRGLLAGAERPYPAHCGLEGPVSELIRFVTKAYAAWKAVSFVSVGEVFFVSVFFLAAGGGVGFRFLVVVFFYGFGVLT